MDSSLATFSAMHWILLIGLGIGLVFVIRALRGGSSKSPAGNDPIVDLSSLTVRDARRGDLLTLRGASASYDDLSFSVDAVHRYESGDDRWFELAGESTEGHITLAWSDDDGLSTSFCFPKKSARLEDLSLSEEDLVHMDENGSADSPVEFEGQQFKFESAYEAGYFKDGRGQGEGFYIWDFESIDERQALSIEKWEDEPFEVHLSKKVDPTDITVYRA